MCKADDDWGPSATPRVRVGHRSPSDDTIPWVLASEGEDGQGVVHCLWLRKTRKPLCVIDKIEPKRNWNALYYHREYTCNDIAHAMGTYLGLLNPSAEVKRLLLLKKLPISL